MSQFSDKCRGMLQSPLVWLTLTVGAGAAAVQKPEAERSSGESSVPRDWMGLPIIKDMNGPQLSEGYLELLAPAQKCLTSLRELADVHHVSWAQDFLKPPSDPRQSTAEDLIARAETVRELAEAIGWVGVLYGNLDNTSVPLEAQKTQADFEKSLKEALQLAATSGTVDLNRRR